MLHDSRVGATLAIALENSTLIPSKEVITMAVQNISSSSATLDKSHLLHMYEQMQTIRVFEERAGKEFAAGKIPGFVHLYAGEEAVAVGVCAHLTDEDFITSHHRGHGHCIAKGVDLREMVAELLGREAGACRGKGGSMHIADVHKGMLGANGIVGGGFPLAAGAGLTAKVNGKGQVAVCFFGDGAANQGTFHEGLNLAGIWKLPVIFVAENNGYAESTPVTYHMSCRDIADRAAGYGMPGVTVDGLDVFAVYEAAGEAVARARRGEGPSLIECKTYRYHGHFEGDTITYRTKEEVDAYRSRDAIQALRRSIVQRGIASDEELDEIENKVQQRIDDAWQFAEASPLPAPEETLTDVYVRYP
jgi:pyruvate dehydrogenase E1 component alpha subunit